MLVWIELQGKKITNTATEANETVLPISDYWNHLPQPQESRVRDRGIVDRSTVTVLAPSILTLGSQD